MGGITQKRFSKGMGEISEKVCDITQFLSFGGRAKGG